MSGLVRPRLKIFHVATDFIVATNAEEAKKFYIEMTGETDPGFLEEIESEIEEVPRDRWASMEIVDIDEPGQPKHTFQQAFDDMMTWPNQEYPKVIATSEY
jgi:hypothetical protein